MISVYSIASFFVKAILFLYFYTFFCVFLMGLLNQSNVEKASKKGFVIIFIYITATNHKAASFASHLHTPHCCPKVQKTFPVHPVCPKKSPHIKNKPFSGKKCICCEQYLFL